VDFHRLAGSIQGAEILIGRLHGPEGRDQALGPALVQTALAEVLAALPPADDAAVRLTAAGALSPLFTWIRAHLTDPITVDGLARICGLSRSRLHAVCRIRLGKAPMTVVRDLRLEAAAHLLLVTDRPLQAIAEACGFADPSHLSHAFRRRHGVPPLVYRSTQRLPTQSES
jgi:transcriptional regulator GlxA family with amidase domain